MNPSEVFFFCLVLLMLAWQAKCNDKYDIPVAINPLIQDPDAIDAEVSFFYNSDKIFFSKVTVIDATINAEQPIQETIQKKISVVFLTVASSHVSGTLKLDDLRYKTKSKWSYSVDVRSILKAGTLTKIDDQTIIYKIQENAMKVLEERFDFEKSEILNRLEMQSMEYYAVDEAKWIKVVEIIVEKVIANRSESLKLTSCYLAEMVGKTVAQMQGFTLNEVDMHIYNKTVLLEKLPEYRNNVLTQLYQTFEMTSTDLAKISGTNLSEINTMTLNDVLKLFTNSVLSKLRVTALDVAEKDSSFDPEMLLSCTDKWEPFKSIVVPESFDNSAQAMAVEVKVLSNLIETNYTEIRQLAILEMINLLEMTIDPLSADKKLIETTILSDVLSRDGSDKINSNEDDIFEVIYKFTNFTERQLTILYGWTSKDYQFSALFTLEDTNSVCNIKYLSYDLLALAKLTVGQMGDISCKSFNVLKEIWERRSVAFLEDKYSSEQQLQLDIPISETVRHLTKAPSTINYRVLNVTSETKELISKLSINNITAVTTYQSEDLKALPFQDVIGIIVHLKRNGSFDHQLVSHFILTLTPSLMTTPITNFYITNNNRPTSTNQILRKTSAEHRTSTFSHMDTIVLTSSLLRFLSTSQMPKNTFMTLPNQANTTMSRHRTGNGTATHPVPSTTKHLSAEYTSLSQSKIRSTLGVNSTTSSYNSVAIKNTLNNTKMLNYTKSTIRNISFPDSTLQPLTSFLPSRYNSNSQSNILYINPTTSKEHFVEYTSISNASAMISSSNDSNISKTIVTISSNETKRIMTEESPSFSTGIGSNVPVGHTTIRLTPSTVIDTTSTAVLTKNVAGVSTNTFTPGQYSSNNTQHSKVSQTKYSIPTSTHRASQIKIINSTSSQSQRSHLTDSSIITHNTRTSDMKLGTEKILTKTKSRIISVKQNHSTTDMSTVLVTPHNTMMETTSTKVMVNTTKSSAVAGTDPSSYKQHTTSNGNKSLPTMISLVIQTTHIESIKHTSAQATTPHVTPSITATTVVIPKKMTSFPTTLTKLDTSSMFEASTIMNVFQSTAKTSTTTNHPKSRMTAVLIPSSNPYTTNAQVETSTPHILNYVLSTSPIISEPTILPTSMTSLIKPSTTKVAIALSSSQQTAATCQSACKANEICTSRGQTPTCIAAQHLEGNMRITSGANFTADLQNKTSEAFVELANQILKVIDSIFNRSQFASSYIGAQVLRFEQGSVIVIYKLTFDTSNALSDNTLNDMAQVLKNAENTNFTIDNSSISVKDFDECSSQLSTKCYKTATCNNTLGSYSCICPKGTVGDGFSCEEVNSANSESKEEVPWIIYVVIAIMVVLIIFLIVVIIYCEKKHKKKHRPQVLDFYNGGINMYPRSTSYLAQTPESEADLADGLGIVNKHGPQLNMVTFNPTPEDTKELELQKGQPGVFQYRL